MDATSFVDFTAIPTPDEIRALYEKGYKGVLSFTASHAKKLLYGASNFYDAFPSAKGAHKLYEFCLPIRAAQTVCGQEFVSDSKEAQQTGDCVGKMVANQGMVDGTMDAIFEGKEWPIDPRTWKCAIYCDENIYGMRGWSGEGANCADLWNCVGISGGQGFLHRGKYCDGKYDLSTYNHRASSSWGARGTPSDLSNVADDNPAAHIYTIRSWEEALDAIAMGFGLGRCGNEGFSSKRDSFGFSAQQGSWAHAIAIGGFWRSQSVLNKFGDALILYYHKWGMWNSGDRPLEIPHGSWFVNRRTVENNIRSGEVVAISGVVGKVKSQTRANEYVMDRASDLRQKAPEVYGLCIGTAG